MSAIPEEVAAAAFRLYEQSKDDAVRKAIIQAGQKAMGRQVCYTPDEVEQVRKLSTLSVTKESYRIADREGVLLLPLTVAANGAESAAPLPVLRYPPSPGREPGKPRKLPAGTHAGPAC